MHDERLAGCRAVVLGAGGAARASVLALEHVGAGQIAVVNRSLERAERLRQDLEPAPVVAIASDSTEAVEELREARVLINATALGWKRGEMPLTAEQIGYLPGDALVVDITYRDTDLLELARGRGLRVVDGLEMLVFQGARSFEIWTGQPAPVEIMMSAALAARTARS